jgi:hypothetical protein
MYPTGKPWTRKLLKEILYCTLNSNTLIRPIALIPYYNPCTIKEGERREFNEREHADIVNR